MQVAAVSLRSLILKTNTAIRTCSFLGREVHSYFCLLIIYEGYQDRPSGIFFHFMSLIESIQNGFFRHTTVRVALQHCLLNAIVVIIIFINLLN